MVKLIFAGITPWHPDAANGLSFEQEIAENGTISNRHFINAGGMSIAVAVTTGLHTATPAAAIATINVVQYWHKDNLGSTVAATNATGVVLGRYSYDPFGKRRDITGKYDPWGNLVIDWGETGANAGPDRGFTGHEHLDDVGIIHMNGRLYDPHIGRMMQADQIIAGLEDMQFFNRYSYVFNRPTSLVDANGQCPFCIYAIIGLVAARATGIIDQKTFRMGLAIVASVWLGGPQGFLQSSATAGGLGMSALGAAATTGFVAGAIGTGTWEGAFQGMAAAMLFYGAGELAGKDYLNLAKGNSFGRALVHAGAGCINARLSGGSCATGAATAGASKFLSMELPGAETKDVALGTMRAAVIGGTVSVIGGGKFANGAQTAAYQHLFNEAASEARDKRRAEVCGIQCQLANRAAGLEPLATTPPEMTLNFGLSGAAMVGPVGYTIEGGYAISEYGSSCFYYQTCGIAGIGLVAAGGVTVGAQEGSIRSGSESQRGLTLLGGSGPAADILVTKSDSGTISGAKGFGGLGVGIGGGKAFCTTTYFWCR